MDEGGGRTESSLPNLTSPDENNLKTTVGRGWAKSALYGGIWTLESVC